MAARLPRRSTPQRIESGRGRANNANGNGVVGEDDDSKNPYLACRLAFPTPQVGKEREQTEEGGCGCVQRLSLKSVTLEVLLSLSLSLFLAVGGTFGLFVSHRSIRRGRGHTRSSSRASRLGGCGGGGGCGLFLRCCGVKNDSDRQTQRMR